MSIGQTMLSEFDHEMKVTRTLLERIPEDKMAWKPRGKSMTLGRLAGRIAEMQGFIISMIQLEDLDFADFVPNEGAPPRKATVAESRQQVLDIFDKKVEEARPVIAGASDEHLAKVCKLSAGGKLIFALPRAVAIRHVYLKSVVLDRRMLSGYLHLLNAPVPSICGLNADSVL